MTRSIQPKSFIFSFLFLFVLSFNLVCAQVGFTKHIVADHYYGASSVCAYDINNDGLIDVLGSGSNRIAWWKNEGGSPLTFTMDIIDYEFTSAIFVDAADLNNDGHMDVIGAGWEGNQIACWYNDGNAPISWTKSVIDDSFNGAHEVHTADIDSDGDIDVLGASAEDHRITYWENDGNNPVNWTKHLVGYQFLGARSVIGCDVNNDGHTDIVGAALVSDEIAVWLNDGGSRITWTKEVIEGAYNGAHWVHGVDFDDDGDIDIFGVAAIGSNISWWRNNGGSPISWAKQTIDPGFDMALSVATADLDGDGDLDAFGAATGADAVAWYRNDGGDPIQWTRTIIDNNFDEAWGLFGADLDNDGDIDILSTAATANEIAWYENNITTDLDDQVNVSTEFSLEQNYPNPFNPSTVISYQLTTNSHVILKIYDLLGNEITTLVNGNKPAGYYSVSFNASNLPSGVYIYTLQTSGQSLTRKMLLMK